MAQQNWTDDRLEERFDYLDAQIAEVREEMKAGNAELREEIGALGAQFAALNRTLIQAAFGITGAIAAAVLIALL